MDRSRGDSVEVGVDYHDITNINNFPEVWSPNGKAKDRGVGWVRHLGRNWYDDACRKVIEELCEKEKVLTELVQVEGQRKEEEEYQTAVVGIDKKVEDTKEDIKRSKELEDGLAVTLSELGVLRDEPEKIAFVSNMEENEDLELAEASELLESVMEELEGAKKELASVKEEGLQFMSSMNIIRTELVFVAEERARMDKSEGKADSVAQYLNLELVRSKTKLESATAAEGKAKKLASNLRVELELRKKEAEAAKRETRLLNEQIATIGIKSEKMGGEIDSAEERLQAAMEEMESAQASEAAALKHLESQIKSVPRERASVHQNRAIVTVSKYEYDYLIGQAVEAELVAYKKVSAAMAWVGALEASKREIVMRSEKARREVREMRVEEEQYVYSMEMALLAKRRAESELMNRRLLSRRIEGMMMNQRSRSRRVEGELRNLRSRSRRVEGELRNLRSCSRRVEGELMNQRSRSRRVEGELMNQRSRSRRVEGDLMNQRSCSRRAEGEWLNQRSFSVKRRIKFELKNWNPKLEKDSKADNVKPTLPTAPAGFFHKSSALPMNRCPSLTHSTSSKLQKKKVFPNLFKLLNGRARRKSKVR
ncbi:hypothetical protein MLD38_040692 [Melastoma candidum]|nr:hypothetical protein MLD38_040692 [Melastoma candidum]